MRLSFVCNGSRYMVISYRLYQPHGHAPENQQKISYMVTILDGMCYGMVLFVHPSVLLSAQQLCMQQPQKYFSKPYHFGHTAFLHKVLKTSITAL